VKIAVPCSFEKLIYFDEGTRCHIPEDSNIVIVVRTSNFKPQTSFRPSLLPLGYRNIQTKKREKLYFFLYIILLHLCASERKTRVPGRWRSC